jgi:hypothetical protein
MKRDIQPLHLEEQLKRVALVLVTEDFVQQTEHNKDNANPNDGARGLPGLEEGGLGVGRAVGHDDDTDGDGGLQPGDKQALHAKLVGAAWRVPHLWRAGREREMRGRGSEEERKRGGRCDGLGRGRGKRKRKEERGKRIEERG